MRYQTCMNETSFCSISRRKHCDLETSATELQTSQAHKDESNELVLHKKIRSNGKHTLVTCCYKH